MELGVFVFELKGNKEPIQVAVLFFVHWILGLGIAIIGQRTKNRNEFIGGLIFFLIFLLMLVAKFVFPCSEECKAALNSAAMFPENTSYVHVFCRNCPAQIVSVIYGILSVLSWLYIIGRLVLIYQSKETPLKII